MADHVNNDEAERLLSRVNQQSTLIEMLKERADKTQKEETKLRYNNLQLSQCEKRYESALKQVSQLQTMLAKVNGEKAILDERFHTLAENHEQMIRIKDEYKAAVSRFSGEQKRDSVMVEHLQEELRQTKSTRSDLDKKCELLERRVHELDSKRETETNAHKLKIEELTCCHYEERNALKRSLERADLAVKAASEERDRKTKQITKLQADLEHSKQSLSHSEADRQEQVTIIHTLEGELAQSKQKLEQIIRAHKEELSRDSHISRLRKELEESEKKLTLLKEEYLAFKAHSNHLLAHERELNNKLRHLLD